MQMNSLLALTFGGLALGARADHLPTTSEDAAWIASVQNRDLESSRIDLRLNGSGTSTYLKISDDGGRTTLGAFLLPNTATNPETELVTYNVARALDRSDLAGTAIVYTLGPRAIRRFASLLAGQSYRNAQKETNRQNTFARLNRNPSGITGVYKGWKPLKPYDLDSMVSGNRFVSGSTLGENIQASNPIPSNNPVSLRGVPGSESELTLSKQLSTIFLLDALVGQWDRFSGGNLQAYSFPNGRAQLVALDNGGGSIDGSDAWLTRYLGYTSRFERDVANQILALNDFVNGRGGSFLGFSSRGELLNELGLSASAQPHFARKLRKVAEHIEDSVAQHGTRAYFP